MAKRSDEVAELVHAATVIERDLRRFEELSRSIENLGLHSEKSIARAGRTLQEALHQQEQLASDLRLLGEAMVGAQVRQQRAIEVVAARALAIQQAATQLSEHMERFAALGTKAAEVTRSLQALHGVAAEGDGQSTPAEVTPGQLQSVEGSLLALAEEAKALATSAEGAGLVDIAREASSLRQKLESAHRRLTGVSHKQRQQTN